MQAILSVCDSYETSVTLLDQEKYILNQTFFQFVILLIKLSGVQSSIKFI